MLINRAGIGVYWYANKRQFSYLEILVVFQKSFILYLCPFAICNIKFSTEKKEVSNNYDIPLPLSLAANGKRPPFESRAGTKPGGSLSDAPIDQYRMAAVPRTQTLMIQQRSNRREHLHHQKTGFPDSGNKWDSHNYNFHSFHKGINSKKV